MRGNNAIKLIVLIIICEFVGIVQSIFTTNSIATWYEILPKPAINPPVWLFAPIWTLLYGLIGIAIFLVWKKRHTHGKDAKFAIILFFVQLTFNALWTPAFFGLHNVGLALFDISILFVAVIATIYYFDKVSRLAMILMFPYLIWIGFALYLNTSIWQDLKNPANVLYCYEDTRICPDGTKAGRFGEKCEFSNCSTPKLWKTSINKKTGLDFKYPESLPMKYMSLFDWPPKAELINRPFSCREGGNEITRVGETRKVILNGRKYCINKKSEGAAGSVYTTFTYSFPFDNTYNEKSNKIASVSFVIRFTQCGNYPPKEQSECLIERSSFNINDTIDVIAQSLQKM